MWDLWWTKWHWERVFSELFNFPLSIPFHWGSVLIYHLGRTIGPVMATVHKDIVLPHQHEQLAVYYFSTGIKTGRVLLEQTSQLL
jgi:hypothetical protein